MKIFLDTLDGNIIKQYSNMGIISGITTNPTFSKRFGMHDDVEMINKIRTYLGKGEIHVEAFGETKEEIIDSAYKLINSTNDDNLVFKIPFSESGISACSDLIHNGIKTNLHLIYSMNQALLAASVKSSYICPLVGRLDEIGHDAMENVNLIHEAYKRNQETTLIMISSVRHTQHVLKAYLGGMDAITIPPTVLTSMFYHPLTDSGYLNFKNDIISIRPISSLNINKNALVNKKDTIKKCLSIMIQYTCGSVIAIDENHHLEGIFTAGDLKRIINCDAQFSNLDNIDTYLNKNPIVIDIRETIGKAKELFKEKNINQLVVMDDTVVVGLLELNEVNY